MLNVSNKKSATHFQKEVADLLLEGFDH